MSYTPLSVLGVGDYVQYQVRGALDTTTGSVDWTTPATSSAGTSIALDDSEDWISITAGWGYAVPVLAKGTYTMAVMMKVTGASDESTFGLGLTDPAGAALTPWSSEASPEGHGVAKASASWTLHVPDGTHVDFAFPPHVGTGGTLDFLTVTIQNVGSAAAA